MQNSKANPIACTSQNLKSMSTDGLKNLFRHIRPAQCFRRDVQGRGLGDKEKQSPRRKAHLEKRSTGGADLFINGFFFWILTGN